MARHEHEKYKIAFETPDSITVDMRLKYFSILGAVGLGAAFHDETYYHRLWEAAKPIITSMECEYMTKDVDLEKATNPLVARAIMWIGWQVHRVMYDLDAIPKN